MMADQGRLIWLDAMRLCAGVSMLMLHCTADPTGQPWAAWPEVERWAPMLVRAVLYIARTELFLMISIFLLLMALDRRPRSYAETMTEQCRRLLIPFAFWTLFYAFYELIKADAFGYAASHWTQLTDPWAWARYLLLGEVKFHMHFIPTLFGLVVMYPLFRIAVEHPWIGVGVIACLVLKRELDAFVWSTFWGTDALPWLVRGVKILTYAGYGLVAASFYGLWKRFGTQMGAWVPLVGFAMGLLFLIKLIAVEKTVAAGAWPFGYTPGYWADFLMPVMLFLLAMLAAGRAWPPILSRLAPYSFGLYLCHPMVLDLIEIALRDSPLPPIGQVGIKIAGTLAATSLIVAGIARLSPLAWTIGLGPLPFLSRRETPAAPRPKSVEV